jgi:hypothetical protein
MKIEVRERWNRDQLMSDNNLVAQNVTNVGPVLRKNQHCESRPSASFLISVTVDSNAM